MVSTDMIFIPSFVKVRKSVHKLRLRKIRKTVRLTQVHKVTINTSNTKILKAYYRKCIRCGLRVVVFL